MSPAPRRSWQTELRRRLVSFSTWPFLFMLDCIFPDPTDGLPLLFVIYGLGLAVTLAMMAASKENDGIIKEVAVYSGIFLGGVLIPTPQAVHCGMVTGTCEERAVEKVSKMRTGIEHYARAHDGKRVEEVMAMIREGHLAAVPFLWQKGCGGGAHAENNRVRFSASRDSGDSGEWVLVGPEDPQLPVEVRIDCTHVSENGRRWSEF